jgi:hypothetical protein
MGFFNTILEKLGLKKAEVAAPAKPAAAAAATVKPMTAAPVVQPKPAAAVQKEAVVIKDAPKVSAPATPAAPAVVVPTPVSEVDVVKHLEQLSLGKGLDWKVSIVDLLKLLDIDSSREARNELATELGCPADLMHDSAKMNVWLHKEVLKQIAKNGGNIPASMLD